MLTAAPVIQVLSKNNYEDQHLVSLPNALLLPRLASSSIRIRSTTLSLTTNNFSYARMGHLLGWWDVHPLRPSIPAEYSDLMKYGRISAWGWAQVIESNISGIDVGMQIFGYLPIGTFGHGGQAESKRLRQILRGQQAAREPATDLQSLSFLPTKLKGD